MDSMWRVLIKRVGPNSIRMHYRKKNRTNYHGCFYTRKPAIANRSYVRCCSRLCGYNNSLQSKFEVSYFVAGL